MRRLSLGFAIVCLFAALTSGVSPAHGQERGHHMGRRHAYGKHHMLHGRGLHTPYHGNVGHGQGMHAGGVVPGGGMHYRPPQGPTGGPVGTYAYPYYTLRGPRDFLMANPPSIGPY